MKDGDIVQADLTIMGGLATYTRDLICREGKLWLVTGWIEDKASGFRKPRRVVCLSEFLDKSGHGTAHDWTVRVPLPMYLFDHDNPLPEDNKFEVVDYPPFQQQVPNR